MYSCLSAYCLSAYLPVCLSACLPIVCLPIVFLPSCLHIFPSAYIPDCLSPVCLFLFLSICLFSCLPVSLSVTAVTLNGDGWVGLGTHLVSQPLSIFIFLKYYILSLHYYIYLTILPSAPSSFVSFKKRISLYSQDALLHFFNLKELNLIFRSGKSDCDCMTERGGLYCKPRYFFQFKYFLV
jgi:hypothetical protein